LSILNQQRKKKLRRAQNIIQYLKYEHMYEETKWKNPKDIRRDM